MLQFQGCKNRTNILLPAPFEAQEGPPPFVLVSRKTMVDDISGIKYLPVDKKLPSVAPRINSRAF